MKRIAFALSAVIAHAAVGLGGAAAFAQASDSVTAVASITGPTEDLTVTGAQSISFGEVAKPNGAVDGGTCGYQMFVFNAATPIGVDVLHFNGDGSRDYSARSGCDAAGAPTYGEFDISCSPGTPVFYDLSYSSSGAGITLDVPSAFPIRFTDPSGAEGEINVNNATNVEFDCYEGGEATVAVGGYLTVGPDAQIGDDVVVGSITLDAAYN